MTIGIYIFSSGAGTFLQRVTGLMRQPFIYALLAGLVILKTGWILPQWMVNTVSLVGDVTIPLMLITLGASLAGLKVKNLIRAILFSIYRVFGGFGIAFMLCEMMSVEGPVRGVVLLQAAMPVAVFNYLFARFYKCHADDIAGMVVVSTLLSFLLLPFLASYLMRM